MEFLLDGLSCDFRPADLRVMTHTLSHLIGNRESHVRHRITLTYIGDITYLKFSQESNLILTNCQGFFVARSTMSPPTIWYSPIPRVLIPRSSNASEDINSSWTQSILSSH